MQKKLIIVFCLVIITLVISKAVSAKEEFKLNVDWASFKGKGQNIYLELYYEISKLAIRSVEKGETLWEICNEIYTIPLWLLSSYNADKDINSLSVGEPIVIPVIIPKDKNA